MESVTINTLYLLTTIGFLLVVIFTQAALNFYFIRKHIITAQIAAKTDIIAGLAEERTTKLEERIILLQKELERKIEVDLEMLHILRYLKDKATPKE